MARTLIKESPVVERFTIHFVSNRGTRSYAMPPGFNRQNLEVALPNIVVEIGSVGDHDRDHEIYMHPLDAACLEMWDRYSRLIRQAANPAKRRQLLYERNKLIQAYREERYADY